MSVKYVQKMFYILKEKINKICRIVKKRLKIDISLIIMLENVSKKKKMPEKLFSFFFKYTGGASATRQLPVDAAMEEM